MKISEWLPAGDEWDRLKSIEAKLLRRRASGNIAGVLALLGAAVQIVAALMEKGYGEKLAEITGSLLTLRFDRLVALFESSKAAAASSIALLLLVSVYLLLRRTGFLLREAETPFKYTVWIKPLAFIESTPERRCMLLGTDRFDLLNHDLMERLARRIGRFSVLEEPATRAGSGDKPSNGAAWRIPSHIHVDGHIALREQGDGSGWGIHVMPRIRIGSHDSPATLGHPVFFPLGKAKAAPVDRPGEGKDPAVGVRLDAAQYAQIVERVYASVATEIYRRLDADVREKIALFPSARLQILALYREAEDFARSNTVDAYDRAIGFYRQALSHYERSEIKCLSRWLVTFPWLCWRTEVRFHQDRARVVAGYAKSMVFRRELSAQSGRSRNPLYELPGLLQGAIWTLSQLQRRIGGERRGDRRGRLLAYLRHPLDAWFTPLILRPGAAAFETHRSVLFDLYLADALVQHGLGCGARALRSLREAAATAPERTMEDPLYSLLKGLTEPVTDNAVVHFRQAVERAPDFQMAHWYLARNLERTFRESEELVLERATGALGAYASVASLNYGNVRALFSLGYLAWLVGRRQRASAFLGQGMQAKSIASETFTGELSYCLARVAAETGRFEACRSLYQDGIAAEPGLGTFYPGKTSRAVGSDFEHMGGSMLERYRKYKERVERLIRAEEKRKAEPERGKKPRSVSGQTLKVVHAFVLNDYGNACLRHFHHHGDQASLDRAIDAYKKAVDLNPLDARPWFNLQNAYDWNWDRPRADECFEQASQLSPGWSSLVVSAAVERARRCAMELQQEAVRLRKIEGDRFRAAPDDRKWLDLDRDAARASVADWTRRFSEARDQALDKMRQASRFAGVLASEGLGTLEQARCLASIPWGKLEDGDVELQIRLADLLSIRATAVELEAAEVLLSRLVEMLPEDHDVVLGLQNAAGQIVKARLAFGAIGRAAQDDPAGAMRRFASLSWTQLGQRQIDLLLRLSDLFDPRGETYDRAMAETLLVDLFGVQVERNELADRLSAWERQWEAQDRKVGAGIDVPELIRSTRLLRRAERQYRKIVLGWLQGETRTFVAHWWVAALPHRERSWTHRRAEAIKHEFFGDARIHLHQVMQGWVHFRRGRYGDAERSFLGAIEVKPDDSSYRFCLGLCREWAGDWRGALAAYRDGSSLDPENPVFRNGLGSVYNRIGNGHWERFDYADAADRYGEAVHQAPEEAVYHRNLALALERAGRPEPQAALAAACEAMGRAVSLAPSNPDYRRELRRLATRKAAHARYGSGRMMKLQTAVTELAVEYGAGLEPLISGASGLETGAELNERYANLKKRIEESFGVEVPDARWRKGMDLPSDEYLVMFNEVLLLPLGKVHRERKFCPDLPPDLRGPTIAAVWRADMPRDPVTGRQGELPAIPARDPLTGQEGAWILERAYDPNKIKLKLELYDALEFILRHLRAIILPRLHHFLTRDGVVERLGRSARGSVQAIATSAEDVDALTDMLKAMLVERAPIEPFDEVCWHFLTRPGRQYAQDTIEKMRMVDGVRQRLWGNSKEFTCVPVPSQLETGVAERLLDTGKFRVLAGDETFRTGVLSEVRMVLEDAGAPRPVLVVEDPKTRVFLRRLIEAEFPEVPVLAKREVWSARPAEAADTPDTTEASAEPIEDTEHGRF